MKKALLSFAVLFLLVQQLLAQPQLMNYQGVARDNAGVAIANQDIALKISILAGSADGIPVFTELHNVRTSQFGVFSLKIGTGISLMSDIGGIDWAGSDHYIQIEMDATGGNNFTLMGASQLLSVPYAFHALTAGSIGEGAGPALKNGVPSQAWSLFGNSKTDPARDRLGTTDETDLVFITNDMERLRIRSNGNIDLDKSLKVGEDLSVNRNVYLNILGGETWNYGPFTVDNESASLLTGTLQVDKDALFKEKVTLDNPGLGSDSKTTGALVVAGGTGIGENLFVGGETQLEGAVKITDETSSSTPVAGALTVAGGAGIGGNLNVNGSADLKNTLNVDGAATLKSTLNVEDKTEINGQVTIRKTLETSEGSYNNYPLQVEGSQQGVAIKLTPSLPSRSNNFISFWGGDGSAKGRIEGMQGLTGISRNIVNDLIGGSPSLGDAFDFNDDKNQGTPSVPTGNYFNNDYAFGALSLTLDFVTSIITFAANVGGAGGTACLLGDCDDVVWSAVEMVVSGIQLGGYIAYNEINRGVAFESGGADYAEWLEKNDPNEVLTFGDVVGIRGGLISKDFARAEKFMIVSQNPTVIGAMPDEDEEKKYEKIAFMGQVSVKVIGKVKKGDYILPSGNQDGMAMAVSPNMMSVGDYSRIIGTAWEESDGKKLVSYVNTAVGINSNDMVRVIENMQSLLNDMQIALAQAVPEFQPQFYAVNGNENVDSDQISRSQSLQDISGTRSDALQYTSMEEALSKAKEYAELQDLDLSQYPYLQEMFDAPSQELAQQVIEHYSEVLNRLNAVMSEVR